MENKNNEIWKDVNGWEEFYQISNHGRLKSKTRYVNTCDKNRAKYTLRKIPGRILNCSLDMAGYLRSYLMDRTTNRRKNILIHRLVALEFIDNPDNKPHINHKDGIKTNNHVDNLEWCTHKENMHHAIKTGLMTPFNGTDKGEKCPSSKLSNSQVFEIKKRLSSGERIVDISHDFPVSKSAISEIKAGRAWGHIAI